MTSTEVNKKTLLEELGEAKSKRAAWFLRLCMSAPIVLVLLILAEPLGWQSSWIVAGFALVAALVAVLSLVRAWSHHEDVRIIMAHYQRL